MLPYSAQISRGAENMSLCIIQPPFVNWRRDGDDKGGEKEAVGEGIKCMNWDHLPIPVEKK